MVTAIEREELKRRERTYRDGRPPSNLRGRTVILVDDGLATGATMRAAAAALRQQGAAKIIVAVPVGAPTTCRELRDEVDDSPLPPHPRRIHRRRPILRRFFPDHRRRSPRAARRLGRQGIRGEMFEVMISPLLDNSATRPTAAIFWHRLSDAVDPPNASHLSLALLPKRLAFCADCGRHYCIISAALPWKGRR